MKESMHIFPALNIPPALFFTGSDEKITEAEEKEAARADELRNIFFSPDFFAAEYTTESGARQILHHSTRPGVLFQLSYIGADGVPTMHENYINIGGDPWKLGSIESAAELLRHFVNVSSHKTPLSLRVVTA